MYNSYFGFRESPFSIAPDPRYLYMTDQHREALAHLVYGLNSEGGCILLTGEVGTGKTTVCRCLLEQIPEKANIALVLNPRVSAIELLETICDELHIHRTDEHSHGSGSAKDYTDRINRFLLDANARGEKTVLIIDEAQNLDSSVLEQLRLLTNLETNQRKLLQIVILGQPELLDILDREEMRQLAQRITARYHLRPLKKEEIKGYVGHRLAVAGSHVQLFTDKTIQRLYRLSDGIPRIINTLCDRALLGAYVENKDRVDTATLEKAAKEVFGESRSGTRRNTRRFAVYAAAAAITGLAVAATLQYRPLQELQAPASTEPLDVAASESVPVNGPADTELSNIAVADTTTAEPGPAVHGPPDPANEDTTAAKPEETEPAGTQAAETPDTVSQLESLFTTKGNALARAFRDLFELWQQDYDASRDGHACDFAARNGLRCLHKQGNLRSLALLNRPAVLKLYHGENITYAILTSLDQDEVTIVHGEQAFVVDTAALNEYWLGEYTLLWQTPPYYNAVLQQGTRGPVVQWLDQQLVRIFGDRGVPDISNTYSDELASQVRRFQLSKGLIPDGVAGPNTLIMLNSELELGAPKLRTGGRLMSYILEALKKSEQERGHGSAPGIQSVHSSGIRYNTVRRPLWPYILTAAVILNLSMLIYFVAVDRDSPLPSSDSRSDVTETAPVASKQRPETEASLATVAPVQAEENVPDVPEQDTATAPPAPAAQADESMQQASANTAAENSVAEQQSLEFAEAYTPQRNELPVEIEHQIPIMEFSAHVYSSNPAQRSVVINGRFLEEGDRLASDLFLTEITPKGAIFDFRGYRFHQGVVAAWN